MNFNINDIVEGEIIDFTHEGNGVLKIDNFTIFASNGLIGDKVKVRIDALKKNFATGSVIEVIEPSKDRVELDFDLTESKGGIPLIEYKYEKQLQWKKEKVEKDFEKIAGLNNIVIKETIGMNNPYRYRNHVQIPVGRKNGKTVIGFYEGNSNEIVDMDSSILQPEKGDRIIKILRDWIKRYDIKPYDRKTKRGILRHIGMRFNKDNEVMVILVTGNENLPKVKELVNSLKDENVISIYQNINKLNSSVTYGRQYKKLYGEDSILDYIGDYKFNISPRSFFQVNRTQTEILYKKAIEYLDLNKEDIVYDLYCGIGTISLFVADEAKKVYGIELIKEAIEDAKENARLNNISNVEFIVGKTEEVFPKMTKEGVKANKVVLDPPRKGCERETLEAIVELNPERVVYVSCNPSTLARDIKYLAENGYKVVEVQPVDMFPHSAHVETVCLIEKL
ncbi:MAG: 23S rRNA (uracil(1939)-C(5))-methyltransferase RlmD [Tissierellaceae bacterium]|nr:23S rRNA (uracil(1939)-C(5))-methyltransferase RlmD [Tissierellaceae bacterium]